MKYLKTRPRKQILNLQYLTSFFHLMYQKIIVNISTQLYLYDLIYTYRSYSNVIIHLESGFCALGEYKSEIPSLLAPVTVHWLPSSLADPLLKVIVTDEHMNTMNKNISLGLNSHLRKCKSIHPSIYFLPLIQGRDMLQQQQAKRGTPDGPLPRKTLSSSSWCPKVFPGLMKYTV